MSVVDHELRDDMFRRQNNWMFFFEREEGFLQTSPDTQQVGIGIKEWIQRRDVASFANGVVVTQQFKFIWIGVFLRQSNDAFQAGLYVVDSEQNEFLIVYFSHWIEFH